MDVVPAGFHIMHDPVPAAVTAFALELFHDAVKYQMGDGVVRTIGAIDVFARVEWHPPDFQNHVTHRGVTCYSRPATTSTTAPAPAPPARARGCDVSHYQRGGLQWAGLRAKGCAFAYLKATEGASMKDDTFALNAEHCRAAGVLRGAYHFFRPTADVAAQSASFIATCKAAGPLELPPAVDVEVSDGVAPGVLAAAVEHFIALITPELGRPVVYTSPGWWASGAGNAHLARVADLWVAHWGAAKPSMCGDWTSWLFWQTSDRSTFAGDADAFNDTETELRAKYPTVEG